MTIFTHDEHHTDIEIQSMKMDNHGQWAGGSYVHFETDHGTTEARWMYFDWSAPQIGGKIRTWSRELTADECLEWCEENYGGKTC